MYDNIGGKIKGLAKILCALESISTVIWGLYVMAEDADLALIGFLIIIGGVLVTWVSTFLLYGFGELIDKACAIERNTRGQNAPAEPPTAAPDSQRIQQLEDLRAQGLITEEEYQAQQAQIIQTL